MSPHQGVVLPLRRVVEELLAQVRLGRCRLRHQEQSARVLVDAVHESHRRVIGVKVLVVAQVPGDGVHQRSAEVAAARMDHHPRRLVDDHQVLVFVGHLQRDVLRHDLPVPFRMVQHQRHHVARLHPVVALDGLLIHPYAASLSSLLYAVAARVRHVVHEELIHSHHRLSLVRDDAPMLVLCGSRLRLSAPVLQVLLVVPSSFRQGQRAQQVRIRQGATHPVPFQSQPDR